MIDPYLNRTTVTYDGYGDVRTIKDALNRVTTLTHDARDRLINVTDPTGAAVTMTFDGVGDLTSFIDANGNQTTYAYDATARLTGMTEGAGSPVQRQATMIYDAVGNLLSMTTGIAGTNPHLATQQHQRLYHGVRRPGSHDQRAGAV